MRVLLGHVAYFRAIGPTFPRYVRSSEAFIAAACCPPAAVVKNRLVQKVTTDQVAEWLAGLARKDGQKGLSSSTKTIALSVLHQVFEYAANPRRGYIARNPCAGLERRERPKPSAFEVRVFEPEEFEGLLRNAEPWLRPLLQAAITTGMRIGELLALRWQDVDFGSGQIHVRHTADKDSGALGTPKGNRTRVIDLFSVTRTVLAEVKLAAADSGPADRVFPYLHRDVARVFEQARKRANLAVTPRELRFHDLRHTHASTLLNDGAKSIVYTSKRLGHSSITITLNTYAHVIRSEEHAEAAEERLSEVFGGLLTGEATPARAI